VDDDPLEPEELLLEALEPLELDEPLEAEDPWFYIGIYAAYMV
jgi:hypothetical protein